LLIRLQGEVELIYCDQGKAEAFINPVIQQLFKAGPTDKLQSTSGLNFSKKPVYYAALPEERAEKRTSLH
jgi:hypothetical protein